MGGNCRAVLKERSLYTSGADSKWFGESLGILFPGVDLRWRFDFSSLERLRIARPQKCCASLSHPCHVTLIDLTSLCSRKPDSDE